MEAIAEALSGDPQGLNLHELPAYNELLEPESLVDFANEVADLLTRQGIVAPKISEKMVKKPQIPMSEQEDPNLKDSLKEISKNIHL